ncbi:MAG: 23S rRNA (adenine(2030)-N(6))-methyltransferase RlmJ [Betaproteobacteria bacterium]|nr:23S rRNA (adenine(2030)-N(6))-methyltransferase RlmJ [Betaproteobacteria bacterium]
MLSYRHLFHAGNFADVFKHPLLTRLLLALNQKDKPYFYLDTHAGIGRYDLSKPWAQKNREFETGIKKLWARDDVPAALKPYLDIVRAENADGHARFYPGSPLIARRLIRPIDRIVATELNKTDCAELQTLFARDRRVTVKLMDGYQSLKAHLPPKERRGLVLIDSSFDRAREFARIAAALREAHQRWETGIYALWYPLMGAGVIRGFERDLLATGIKKVLQFELRILPDDASTIPGCGMIIINPPWKFDTEMRTLLRWLWSALSINGAGGVKVEWLARE